MPRELSLFPSAGEVPAAPRALFLARGPLCPTELLRDCRREACRQMVWLRVPQGNTGAETKRARGRCGQGGPRGLPCGGRVQQ